MTATPDQLQSAFSYCTDFARIMLEKSGEFHPFGAKIQVSGVVEAVGAWTGVEHPEGQEVYELLIKALRSDLCDGRAIAVAVAVNVNIPEQFTAPYRDGLRVTLEAFEYSRLIYVPYRLVSRGLFRSKKTVEFSEPFAVEVKSAV
jgi:hypothetical protein